MSHVIPAEFYIGEMKLPITAFQSAHPTLESEGIHLIREEADFETSLDEMIPGEGEITMKIRRGREIETWRITYDVRFYAPWCSLCHHSVVSLEQSSPALKEESVTLIIKDKRRVG